MNTIFIFNNMQYNITVENLNDSAIVIVNGEKSVLRHSFDRERGPIHGQVATGTVNFTCNGKLCSFDVSFPRHIFEVSFVDVIKSKITETTKWISIPSKTNFHAGSKGNKIVKQEYITALSKVKNEMLEPLEKVKMVVELVKNNIGDFNETAVLECVQNRAAYDLGLPANYSRSF